MGDKFASITFLLVALPSGIGLMIGLWWLSSISYDHGIWPIGALLRVMVWSIGLGLLGITIMGIGRTIASLISSLLSFRRDRKRKSDWWLTK